MRTQSITYMSSRSVSQATKDVYINVYKGFVIYIFVSLHLSFLLLLLLSMAEHIFAAGFHTTSLLVDVVFLVTLIK